jgi:beta-galactosidase/beta-glucuronidase
MGVNAYRASHNAPTPELLDACDSLGMLVMDEQRLLNSSPEYIDQFERLIKRDRNHPSIFMWSIGNEEQGIQYNSFGKRIAQTLLAKQLELDPGRVRVHTRLISAMCLLELTRLFLFVGLIIVIRVWMIITVIIPVSQRLEPRWAAR